MMVEALGCLGPKVIADCTRGHGRAKVPLYEDFSRGREDEEGLNHTPSCQMVAMKKLCSKNKLQFRGVWAVGAYVPYF